MFRAKRRTNPRSTDIILLWLLCPLCVADTWTQVQLPLLRRADGSVCVTWTTNCSLPLGLSIAGAKPAQVTGSSACLPNVQHDLRLLELQLFCGNHSFAKQQANLLFPPVLCSPCVLRTLFTSALETHVEIGWKAGDLQSTSQIHQWLWRSDQPTAIFIGTAAGGVWRDRIEWLGDNVTYVVFDTAYASCPQQTFLVHRPPRPSLPRPFPWREWAQVAATVACVCTILWVSVSLAPFVLVVADSAQHVLFGCAIWWIATVFVWQCFRTENKHRFPRPRTWRWLQQRLVCQCVLLVCTFLRDVEFQAITS
jgi:hypothetical protein